ncbi:MAG: polyprenol monophosphomannose synthase [Alphaproteobacteria bacterium]
MRVVVIVPTYEERANIGPLIAALEAEFQHLPHEMHLLVVDDESPDGTAEVVRAHQAQFANLHLLQGRKAGLGTAYVRGIHHALDRLGAEVVVQMDADFSHRPADVPRLLAALEAGADFVIGSRYVEGGSIPREWRLHRRLMSRLGNLATRFIAGLYHVHDCTAGFRAIRASLLREMNVAGLRVEGYAFLVALLHEAMVHGGRVVEIPVDFIERRHGASKLGLSDIVEFLSNVWWIRLRDGRRSRPAKPD